MKKILVPTDFSRYAHFATDVAISLAEKIKAEIHFIHLMDIPVDWIKLVDLAQKKMYPDITAKVRSAHNKMQALVHRVERRGLKAKKLIQFNSDYRYLMEYTEAFHCDLMIMGSHGSSGITRWFIGSTTQKVVRTSNVPVLVIRQSTPFSSIKEVVFVSGFEKRVMRSFKKVLDLAKILEMKVQLLFINMPANFTETSAIERKMKPFIDKGKNLVSRVTIHNCYDFERGLAEVLDKKRNMIAMATYGSKNSLTQSVINHVGYPVLSLRIT